MEKEEVSKEEKRRLKKEQKEKVKMEKCWRISATTRTMA